MTDSENQRRPHTWISGPEKDRQKIRGLLIRWLIAGAVTIIIFLAGLGVLGGWASSVVNWPHGGAKEVLGYIIGCLAILSIPTVVYAVKMIADVLHAARFEDDESIEQRLGNIHGMIDQTSDLMEDLRKELKDKSDALQALAAQKEEYEQLAALNSEEAEAVSRLVNRTVANANRKASKVGLLLFVLGLLCSVPLGIIAIWIANLIHT